MTTRYQFNDRETYLNIVQSTDVLTCLAGGELPAIPTVFKLACEAAVDAVPMTVASLNNRKREREIRQRLQEALDYRNKWYRKHLGSEHGKITLQ